MATQWQPNPSGLDSILKLFRASNHAIETQNNAVSVQLFKQFETFQKVPEFNNYLVFILVKLTNEEIRIRLQAGLKLKNNLKRQYEHIPAPHREWLKQLVLQSLGDPKQEVRNVTAILISMIAQKESVKAFGLLFHQLVSMVDCNDPNYMDGSFNALCKISEDMPRQLDGERLGRPLAILVPKFISKCLDANPTTRRHALTAVRGLLFDFPLALAQNMRSFLENLSKLTQDPDKEIRKLVCQCFVALLGQGFDYIRPNMNAVINFMLHSSMDADEHVAREACEFWSLYCETKQADLALLKPHLPKLVPILLKGMQYSGHDLMRIRVEQEEDAQVADKKEDIKPRFHTSQNGLNAEDEDWGQEPDNWNLRKCAATSLDTLATTYQHELLPVLMPELKVRLEHAEWTIRESGVLALGAVAKGCDKGLAKFLPQFVRFLLHLLQDRTPLVRSIACWTLGRYSKWVTQTVEGKVHFKEVTHRLLQLVVDENKKVQEAACSAFANLEENAKTMLVEYLDPILKYLMFAFNKYQAKNLNILFDALGTLAEAVGAGLNQPAYVTALLPPLMKKWSEHAPDDRSVFPLLECLTSIARALGTGFMHYSEAVFDRCLMIIQTTLTAKKHAREQNVYTLLDGEFIVCALDLLSGVIEGLGSSAEALVAKPALHQLLLACLTDSEPEVRQSAFALLGDLAKTCVARVRPHLHLYMPAAARNLDAGYLRVCNNASWAIGEVAIKVGADMAPYADVLLQCLSHLINRPRLMSSLLENIAIAIGRLALACPDKVAVKLPEIAKNWCINLGRIGSGLTEPSTEKEDAYRGLCAVIAKNPQGMANFFPILCQCISAWGELEQQHHIMFQTILRSYKGFFGAQWPNAIGTCSPELKAYLTRVYGV